MIKLFSINRKQFEKIGNRNIQLYQNVDIDDQNQILIKNIVEGCTTTYTAEVELNFKFSDKEKLNELKDFLKNKVNRISKEPLNECSNYIELDSLYCDKYRIIDKECVANLSYIIKSNQSSILSNIYCSDNSPLYIHYWPIAEQIKLKRQNKALNSLKFGYAANPFIATYLLEPENIPINSLKKESGKIEWYSEKLNQNQKDAVRFAISTDGIYLIQGPPGTGKTQFISELTVQSVRRGKTVLITSETHKAIDNVFERLPHTQEIRAVRLDPSKQHISRGKDRNSRYYIDDVVENFYTNIQKEYENRINRFECTDQYNSNLDKKFNDLDKKIEKYNQILFELESLNNKSNTDCADRSLHVELNNLKKKSF